jgi:hypothetical protein
MRILFTCVNLCSLLLICSTLAAQPHEQTFSLSGFDTAKTYQKTLVIPEAYELDIHVTGDTKSGKEKLFLCDANDQPVLGSPLSGQIDWHGMVQGSSLRVQFKTLVHMSQGHFTVKITQKDSHQVYGEIREKLVQIGNKILEINAEDIKTALDQHLSQVTALRDKINATEAVKALMNEVVNSLLNLAKIYRSLTSIHPTLTRVHQQQLEEIRLLKQRTQGYQYQARDNGKHAALATETDNAADLSAMYATEQALWEKLFAQEIDLETKLTEFSQKVSLLLDLLAARVTIYQKSADLALMSETAWGVLKQLTPETEVQKLSGEIGEADVVIRKLLLQFQ